MWSCLSHLRRDVIMPFSRDSTLSVYHFPEASFRPKPRLQLNGLPGHKWAKRSAAAHPLHEQSA